MKVSFSVSVLALIAFFSIDIPAHGGLQIGDPAPPLSVSHWLKGGPVDIKAGVGKNAYVIEFWATWCFPCIQAIPETSAMQREHRDKGLVVVALTSAGSGPQFQPLDKVKNFVTKQGQAMDYIVGYDEKNKIDEEYMAPLGAMGIPHAVLVDKAGKIVWSGHPAGGLKEAVARVLSDDYDPEGFIKEQKAQAAIQRAVPVLQRGIWQQGLSLLEEALAIDPANESAIQYAIQVYSLGLNDEEALKKWTTDFMGRNSKNPRALAHLARGLMTIEDVAYRQPELTLQAAKAAYEASDKKNALAVEVYAQVLFSIGSVDQAIEAQGERVKLATDGDRSHHEALLEYYQTCRKLQGEV